MACGLSARNLFQEILAKPFKILLLNDEIVSLYANATLVAKDLQEIHCKFFASKFRISD